MPQRANLFRRFITNVRLVPTLATIIFAIIFILAAQWQFSRAEQKRTILSELNQRANMTPLALAAVLQKKDIQYYAVVLRGYFLNQKQILLDNKIYQHQAGYQVLTPFLPQGSETAVLINRGWIPQGKNRRQLPSIVAINGLQTVTGIISMPSKSFSLGKLSDSNTAQYPLRIQQIDTAQLSAQLKLALYPWIVLQAKTDSQGFVREWEFVTVRPEKNTAYAVQWILMLITLLIIYFVLTIRGKKANQT